MQPAPHWPQELEGLDDAALRDLYEMRVAEQRAAAGREDFSGGWAWAPARVSGPRVPANDQKAACLSCLVESTTRLFSLPREATTVSFATPADLVAAKAAQQKRKAAEKAGKEAKKFKF